MTHALTPSSPALPSSRGAAQPSHDPVDAMFLTVDGIRYVITPRTEAALIRVLDQIRHQAA
jgi:hypothetical protein